MSTALKTEGDSYTPTTLKWSVLDQDGTIWHRYSRSLNYELHLIALEGPLSPTHADRVSGMYIRIGDQHVRRRRFLWSFEIDKEDVPAAEEIVSAMREFFPGAPPVELLERLMLLAKSTPEPFGLTLQHKDCEEIAKAVAEQLKPDLTSIHRGIDSTHSLILARCRRWWQR